MADESTQPHDPAEELANAISASADDADNEELSRILRERFGIEEEASEQGDGSGGVDDDAGEPSSPPPTADDTTPPPTPEPTSPTTPTIPEEIDFGNGLKLTRQQAQEYAEFAAFLEANPDYARLAQEAYEATTRPPAPVAPPDDIDLDDPTVRFLWERIQQSDSRLQSALDTIAAHEASISTQTDATTESLVNRAVSSFQRQHNLNDNEMDLIRQTAARLNILPALMAPVDPRTGQPRKPDPLAAIEESLDTAMWAIPEYRDRALAHQVATKQAEDKKKRDLSKLGGSSGSVPRTTPVPKTNEERKQAMIAELAEMIHGPGQSNEES